MREIIMYLLTIAIIAAVAKILTFVKPYKIALVKRFVKMAEKKYANAEKSGKQKKAFVLKVLKWFLIQTDDVTSNMIDAVVSLSNEKTGGMADGIKSITTAEINEKLDALNK